MSIDTELRATIPTDLPPLDHARLQRAGRRRRAGSRLTAATTVVAVVGIGTVTVAGLVTPSPVVEPLAPSTDEDVEGVDAPATDHADAPATTTPDPDVVDVYGGLTETEVIDRLRDTLDATSGRPDDLVSITVTESLDGERRLEELRGDETADDFPVVTVIHPAFDPADGFETPALQPTWTPQAAELAVTALAASDVFHYDGVVTDDLGRTVLVFAARTVDQQIHVDPASGYTAGTVMGGVEFVDPDTEEAGPDDAGPDIGDRG